MVGPIIFIYLIALVVCCPPFNNILYLSHFVHCSGLAILKINIHSTNFEKMVKAWLMSDQIVDQRLECHREPPVFVDLDALAKLGVEYFYVFPKQMVLEFIGFFTQVPVEEQQNGLAKISNSRSYNYRDEIVVNRQKLVNYEERIKQFFEEHLHTDEEIRFHNNYAKDEVHLQIHFGRRRIL